MNLMLGGLYAFSTLLMAVETALGGSRSLASLVFSLASLGFMAAMLGGGWLQARLSPARLAVLTGALAGGGLALAGLNPGPVGLMLGFGLGYGLANGIGYGLALRCLMQVWTARTGLAAGVAVGAYALGGVVWSAAIPPLLAATGLPAVLGWLALLNGLAAGGAAAAFGAAGHEPVGRAAPKATAEPPLSEAALPLGRLWLGFFLMTTAGLMLLGHAAAVMGTAGATAAIAATGAVAINLGNGLGRLGAGWAVDAAGARPVLLASPLVMAVTLGAIALTPHPVLLAGLIGVAGLCYGAVAAGYPAATASIGGLAGFSRSYGRLFTAWGAGAMLGPALAGALFDATGDYRLGAALGACAALGSAAICLRLPRKSCSGIAEGGDQPKRPLT